jgi:thioredoxin reductase (NADPH)
MVTIIGAGPIGLATGIALKQKDIPFQIIERGCLVNSLYHYPVNMTFFSTSERLEIGGIPFISHGHKPTRSEALEYYRRAAESYELPIKLYEEVTKIEGRDGDFVITTSKDAYQCSKIVIATGFYGKARMMNIQGEELPKVKHYYNEPHPYAWQKVLVIGGGNSAVDVALETYRCNADVTMAVRDSTIKESVKYWVKPDIENRISEGSIKGYFNTEVVEIREREVVLQTPEGEKVIENDFVLAMTGYQPQYELMDMAGIELADGEMKIPVYDEQTLETNRKGIYVAGVVCGGMDTNRLFIENTRIHAAQITNAIAE